MDGWESWSTPAQRLKGARKARGITQEQLRKASGVTQSDISKLERGDSLTTTKWPQLARALGVDALWLSAGDGTPDAAEPQAAHVGAPSIDQAVDLLAEILFALDEDGRSMASTALSNLARNPNRAGKTSATLAMLLETYPREPDPTSPAPVTAPDKSAAAAREQGKVKLTVKAGGGKRSQMALPFPARTVANPWDTKSAPKKERDWYAQVTAAPKAKG